VLFPVPGSLGTIDEILRSMDANIGKVLETSDSLANKLTVVRAKYKVLQKTVRCVVWVCAVVSVSSEYTAPVHGRLKMSQPKQSSAIITIPSEIAFRRNMKRHLARLLTAQMALAAKCPESRAWDNSRFPARSCGRGWMGPQRCPGNHPHRQLALMLARNKMTRQLARQHPLGPLLERLRHCRRLCPLLNAARRFRALLAHHQRSPCQFNPSPHPLDWIFSQMAEDIKAVCTCWCVVLRWIWLLTY
jgi:hypothetical protein